MSIARDCLCEAQGYFLLYVLCSLITSSSLVPVVFSLGCQQGAFVIVDYRDLPTGLPLLANPSFSLFLWSFQYQWKGRKHGLRPSVPFLTTIFPLLFVLPLSRTSFSGVLISPAAYCFISLASYLLSHLTPILQFHLNASSLRITYGCWLFSRSSSLITLLLLCCLHQPVQCCVEDEWRAGIHFSPGKF